MLLLYLSESARSSPSRSLEGIAQKSSTPELPLWYFAALQNAWDIGGPCGILLLCSCDDLCFVFFCESRIFFWYFSFACVLRARWTKLPESQQQS